MPVGASLGAGLIGGAASLFGASSAASASKKALSQQLNEFNQVQAEAKPYISAGSGALTNLQNPNAFMQSPDYQWTLNQGMNQVLQNKAVNGLLNSGSALSGLANYVTGAASTDYNNWFNNQLNVARVGESALYPSGNAASGASGAIGTNATNQGNASLAIGNDVGNIAGSLAAIIQQYGGSNTMGGQGTSSYGGSSTQSSGPVGPL